MAPVPAVSRTMPEEDRPEHIGWGGHPIKTCPVAVVARPVDGGEHHQGRHQKDQQGDHPHGPLIDLVAPSPSGVAQSEVVYIYLVHLRKEGQHTLFKALGTKVAGKHPIQPGSHTAGQDGGEVVACSHVIELVIHRSHQQGVALAQADLGPLVVSIAFDVLPIQAVHHQYGDQTVVPIVPVGVIEADLLLCGGGQHPGLI